MLKTFSNYTLSKDLIRSLKALNYNTPTIIQSLVIPTIMDKKDVVIKSKTGSGKTAAFAIPIINSIIWDKLEPQVLVLTPTRELALQAKEEIFNIGRHSRIKVEPIYGKSSFSYQERQLKQRTHVIVATPGRLLDHINNGTVDLSKVSAFVIDEADELLKMGFIDEVANIIDVLPKNRQTVLLSATMPSDISKLANNYMNDPILIEADASVDNKNNLKQYYYVTNEDKKLALLEDVLIVNNPNSAIIFCNTKVEVDNAYDYLYDQGYLVNKLHGDMEQNDRIKVINDFKHGMFRYLVATDVAARGLDIDLVSLIINYNLPRNNETYVHRIGRSARAGERGKAISFIHSYEHKYIKQISDFTKDAIMQLNIPTSKEVSLAYDEFIIKNEEQLDIKLSDGHEFRDEIVKLHINAGRKTKMRVTDIVGTICAIDGIKATDIGVITLLDISTFVEILNNKGNLVYEALQTRPIKGRMRNVSYANKDKYEIAYEENKF